MLTTQDAEGRMGSRPVTVLKIDERRMWFFIPITGGIADEVKRDPEVHISVMDKDDDLFVSLRGEAQVMRDPAKFLTVYNLCAAKLNQPFRFDPRLAKDLEHLGRFDYSR